MEIQVTEILKLKRSLEDILAKHTGRTAKEISKACERDKFFAADEAKEFGLIDHVVLPNRTPTPPAA
jgi:ATP-dependent Clp protease protease subunit